MVSAAVAQIAPYPPITIPLKLDQVPGKPIWISTGSPGVPGKDNDGIADEKANQRLDQRRGALFPWVDGNTRVVQPDITFRDRMTIALGDRRLTLLYAGPAHSLQRHDDDGRARWCAVRR
jgi:hypothetical protein